MARPIKTGLDYFPMDTTFDDNIELLEAEEGLEGLGIVLKIWQKIYKQGYYIDWEKDNVLLFSKKINSEITRVNSVINTCFKRGIFDKNMYDKYKILTSSGIQKRFFTALKSSKRVSISVVKEYRLVNGEYNGVFTEETSVNSEETSVIANIPTEESTQKKVKKNKEEESKADIDIFFETVWKLYPNKQGKGSISNTTKKKIYGIKEEFERCIERYEKYVKNRQSTDFKDLKFKNGSTFFNTGYIDYLDDNYVEEKQTKMTLDDFYGRDD